MTVEQIKATLIARALHRMANASANLQIVAAVANRELALGGWKSDHEEHAAFWHTQYFDADKALDALLEPLPTSL